MASNYESTTETTNFARLCRLVVDISCDLLRDVLGAQIPPPGLTSFIQSQKHQLLKCLKGHQRQVLYPSGGVFVGTLQDLDFTLLYILARNLQGINIPPHSKGWGKEPDIADRSLSANIDRLRIQRNEAYGHLPNASLPESDFKVRWNLIRQSVFEIEQASLTGDKYVRAVDALLTTNMDPAAEKNYIEELEKLYKEDLEVKDILNDVQAKQKVLETDITATTRDIRDLKDDVTAVKGTLDEISAKTSDVKEIHPDLRAMIEQTKSIIKPEKMEKELFYCTKGFRVAKEKLRQNRVVVIKGNTGDGKTAIAVRLLHWLSQEQHAGQPLQIHNMEKLDLLAPNSEFVTFIDDIFGEKDVWKKDVDEWKKRILGIKSLFVDAEATNFLVITIRNEIFNSLGKGSRETIFTENNIIDLSSDTYQVEEEKRGLLYLYKPENFSWTKEEIVKILTYAPNIGFPQCCQLFYNSQNLQKERSRFFENPFHFLNEALSKLQECSALLYLFFNDGILRVKDLDPNSQNVNKELLEEAFDINLISGEDDSSKLRYKKKVTFVKESLEKLLGFLVMTGKHWRSGEDVYRFHHDSIYVAVALLYGKVTPVGYIQNCPSKSLSYLTTSETATNMIAISSDHYTEMCERLLREFKGKKLDRTRGIGCAKWYEETSVSSLGFKGKKLGRTRGIGCAKWYEETSVSSLDVWNDPAFVERFVCLFIQRNVDKHANLEEGVLYLLWNGKVKRLQPDKITDLGWLGGLEHRDDGNQQVCLLKEVVVYLNDETKLEVLNEACESGTEECALYLLSEGIKPDKNTAFSLVRSRHWNDDNRQLCLLKKIVVYLNEDAKFDVLNEACKSGAEECALYLLSEGVQPDKNTVLSLLRHGDDGDKQVCLLKKIVVYLNDDTKLGVLNELCKSGAEECALYLLCEEAVKPDEGTVFDVVRRGSIDLVRILLEYNITPTARYENNSNVLHWACLYEREEAVILLCNTYPHLVLDINDLRQTPLHVVAQTLLHLVPATGNFGLFQMMERCALNSLYRVENKQTKCDSVDGCVVHKYCLCAQYMSQLVDGDGGTVLHYSCGRGDRLGEVNREVCLYLCRSYPGLTTTVTKEGFHCLHYIARCTSYVDVFTQCEAYVKQYIESMGNKYDVTTILTNDGKSVLDMAKRRAKDWGSESNPLVQHLVKVFDK